MSWLGHVQETYGFVEFQVDFMNMALGSVRKDVEESDGSGKEGRKE